jgi:hypothetical protein
LFISIPFSETASHWIDIMTPADAPQKFRKTPMFTAYEVVWSALGALALGVLMVLALAPDWLDDLRPASSTADPQSNQGQRAAARLAADVNALKQSVAQVQLDLAQVKTEVTTKVASLETRLGFAPATTAPHLEATAAPAPAAQPLTAARPQIESLRGYATPNETTASATPAPAAAETEAAAEPAPPPASAHAPKVINADATVISTGLTTGTVSDAGSVPANAPTATAASNAISFGPAVVKHAPKPVGIKLASGASVDSLRLSWSLLADKHSDALKSLEARYVTGGDAQNPNFDLVAGPIKSKAQANKVCKDLAAKGVPCTVGAFGGDAL